MKMKLKSILALALCAVGFAAFAEEPDAVQLWEGGPYFATSNLGTPETHDPAYPAEYGALYKFDNATNEVAKLGDGWRVPSDGELEMLAGKNNGAKVCSNVWTTCNGVAGRRFFGMTPGYEDKSIFLPAAGNGLGKNRTDDGKGYYWSSAAKDASSARGLHFNDDDSGVRVNAYSRSYGLSVRAVRDTPPTPTPPEPSDEEVVATAEATFVLGPALAVANVKTATHWPWDGKIDVSCDLTGMGKVQLSAALTTNGVTVCTATAENVTGATEIDLDQVGGVTNGVKFGWDAKADCPADFNSTDTKVKVTAKKVVPPAGALPGEFSVSATKKVHFSKGNLYAKKDGSTWNWGFYDKQYKFNSLSMPQISSDGGSRIATSGDNEIDLFTWGYSASYSSDPKTTSYITTHTTDGDNFSQTEDWGSITGLPAAPSGSWCTLSKDEWVWLLGPFSSPNPGTNCRTSSTVNTTKNARYLRCKVNDGTTDVYGVIIFPDTFTWPTGAGDAPQASYINDKSLAWTSVPGYTAVQFAALEEAGVVFLPAAGYRNDASVSYVGCYGYYWSSTAKSSTSAYYLSFFSSSLNPASNNNCNFGRSVRLVTEVK